MKRRLSESLIATGRLVSYVADVRFMKEDGLDLQRLMLAFTVDKVREVIGADAVFTPEEIEFLNENFPEDLLRDCGFVSEDGSLTTTFEADRNLALIELPHALSMEEKLALVEILLDACAADSILQREEAEILAHAADALQVPQSLMHEQVQRWLSAGKIRLG